mgnify:CR=1 FL=1
MHNSDNTNHKTFDFEILFGKETEAKQFVLEVIASSKAILIEDDQILLANP